MMQVTSPIPETYSIHEPGQRPAEGVLVWEYPGGRWLCERCTKRFWATGDVDSEHIELAKKHKEKDERDDHRTF